MSQQLLASKIVIVEEEPKVRTIQGVTTSITGFLGSGRLASRSFLRSCNHGCPLSEDL